MMFFCQIALHLEARGHFIESRVFVDEMSQISVGGGGGTTTISGQQKRYETAETTCLLYRVTGMLDLLVSHLLLFTGALQ